MNDTNKNFVLSFPLYKLSATQDYFHAKVFQKFTIENLKKKIYSRVSTLLLSFLRSSFICKEKNT